MKIKCDCLDWIVHIFHLVFPSWPYRILKFNANPSTALRSWRDCSHRKQSFCGRAVNKSAKAALPLSK